MSQFVKAVLFDLDGTLIDTAADFVRIIGKMSQENGWQAPPETEIRVDSCVFSALEEVLSALEEKGVPWGIVTNKPRYLSELLLEKMQLDTRCAVLVCPDDVSRPKPDPEPMHVALEKLGIPRGAAESVIYVGDHIRDIEAGNAADMSTILAAYGYIPPEDQHNLKQWGADYIIDTPEQLKKLLLSSGKFDYL